MNFGVSPDVDARICYVAVFALGAAASVYQLWNNLGSLLGVWTIIDAWTVFLVYSIVPVGLFWLLDRTGAISDTSIFAAVIVGIGYQQILAGQSSLQGPPEAASFWKFLAVWTARMLPRIRDRMGVNSARFRDSTVSAAAADPEKLKNLKELAQYISSDLSVLKAQLDTVEAQRDQLGDKEVKEKQARIFYEAIANSSTDFGHMLMTRRIISRGTYLWYARQYRSKATGTVVLVLSAAVFAVGVWYTAQPEFRARYYVWRLEKADASKADLFRSREALLAMMRECDQQIYDRVAIVLENDSLPPEVIGRASGILIEGQPSAASCKVDLVSAMLNGLRNANPDSRARIQSALIYIAGLQSVPIPDGFAAWHPSSDDSIATLDTWIRKWHSVAKPAS